MKRLLVVMFLGAAGCLNLAEERARRDETIGHYETVDVQEGRAVVRAQSAEAVTLWVTAPELEATLQLANPTTLRLENVLADAELVATDADTTVGPRSSLSATEAEWLLQSTSGVAHIALRAPDSSDLSPWRFLMFADVQDAIDRVQDIYDDMNAITDARFVVMAGDLTERGTEAQMAEFREKLHGLGIPLYVTLGNHELGVSDNPYYRWFGRGSHTFRFRGVQLTFVDTASATVATRTRDWLSTWLDQARDLPHVAIMHIPPIDPIGARAGSFSSKNEAYGFLSDLAGAGVDLTLYGHVHSFYAYDNAGIPAFIAGGGGAIPERMDGVGRHFLAIDVDPVTQRFETALIRVD